MLVKSLLFDQINPFIRYVQQVHFKTGISFTTLKAYDCRLFYVCRGEGIICIENKNYNVSKGHLLLWQPGIKYHLISHENNCLDLIGINFDFLLNHSDKNSPIPPDRADIFRNEKATEVIEFSDMEAFNSPIILQDMEMFETDLREIAKEFATKKKYYNKKISGLFLSILVNIARVTSSISTNMDNSESKADIIIHFIHNNFSKDLTNHDIGIIFNFHPNYINKLMVSHTGMSLHKYLLIHRISQAIHLIQTTSMSISEIAYMVGFKDTNHFSKYFKKVTGRKPGDFRKIEGASL